MEIRLPSREGERKPLQSSASASPMMNSAERLAKAHSRSLTVNMSKGKQEVPKKWARKSVSSSRPSTTEDDVGTSGTAMLKRVRALLDVILESASKESLTVSTVKKLVPFAIKLLDEAEGKMGLLETEANKESAGRYLWRLHDSVKDEEDKEIIKSLVTNYHKPKKTITPKNQSDQKNSAHRYLSKVLRVGTFIAKTRAKIEERKSENMEKMHLSMSLQSTLLNTAGEWDFDIFELGRVCERPLLTLSMFLFHKLDLFRTFAIDPTVMATFLHKIEDGYKSTNAYHNALHAADVVQSAYFLLKCESAASMLTPLDILSTLLAAAIHDFQHPGTNNAFHVATGSDLALLYNDQSVLENMHCSEAFRVLRREDCAIAHGMPPEQWHKVRHTMVQMVLATDMSHHFTNVNSLQLHNASDCKSDLDLLKAMLHAADISHPAKPPKYHQQWTLQLTEEFYGQGDEERKLGLPVSALMDRERPANMAKSQVGFIDHIVGPLFSALVQVVPEAKECMEYVQQNRSYWQSLPPSAPSRHGTAGPNFSLQPQSASPNFSKNVRELSLASTPESGSGERSSTSQFELSIVRNISDRSVLDVDDSGSYTVAEGTAEGSESIGE